MIGYPAHARKNGGEDGIDGAAVLLLREYGGRAWGGGDERAEGAKSIVRLRMRTFGSNWRRVAGDRGQMTIGRRVSRDSCAHDRAIVEISRLRTVSRLASSFFFLNFVRCLGANAIAAYRIDLNFNRERASPVASLRTRCQESRKYLPRGLLRKSQRRRNSHREAPSRPRPIVSLCRFSQALTRFAIGCKATALNLKATFHGSDRLHSVVNSLRRAGVSSRSRIAPPVFR